MSPFVLSSVDDCLAQSFVAPESSSFHRHNHRVLVDVMIHHISRSSSSKLLCRNLLSFSRTLCSHSAPIANKAAASATSSVCHDAVRDCSTVKEEEWKTPKYKLKLTDIPFQAKVANAVQLIGTVSLPVSIKMDKDGRRKAVTILVQEKNPDFPTFSSVDTSFSSLDVSLLSILPFLMSMLQDSDRI